MTDPKLQARDRAIDYLVRLVQMNPFQEGEAIIRARSAALGLSSTVSAPARPDQASVREEKRKLLERLEGLRAGFWTMPLAELQRALEALEAREFPELEAVVVRLRVVAAHRSEFPKLTALRGFNGDFFSAFKEVLVSSPRDVAVLKEQVLSSFRNRGRRRRGRRMVRLLKKTLPEVYALEADWLDVLYRQKVNLSEPTADSYVSTVVVSRESSSIPWWVYYLLAFAALQLLMFLARNS